MLWHDRSLKGNLAAALLNAATYYRETHKAAPNLAYVHPSMLGNDTPSQIEGVNILPLRNVVPFYIWLGRRKL